MRKGIKRILSWFTLLRLFLIALLAVPVIFFRELSYQIYYYASGNVINNVIVSQWHIVAISIALFLVLLIPLSFRRRANWMEKGIFSAFVISLFIEMYGIPLTIIIASGMFFQGAGPAPAPLFAFETLGVTFSMDLGMTYGLIVILTGVAFIVLGWLTLYRNRSAGLVTSGIYRYSRHPQNLGIVMISLGWFIAWPTILTMIFAPILIYRYVTLSRKEEAELSRLTHGYDEYKKQAPFLA